MLKIIGVLMIISATTYAAMYISSKKRIRASELCLIKDLATDFLNEIKFNATRADALFEKYLSKPQYKPLQNLELSKFSITEEEKCQVSEFIKGLGRSSKEMQLKSIEHFILSIDKASRGAEEKLGAEIKMTNSIGFFGGVFISLLIL